jgi:hypothetical protein
MNSIKSSSSTVIVPHDEMFPEGSGNMMMELDEVIFFFKFIKNNSFIFRNVNFLFFCIANRFEHI